MQYFQKNATWKTFPDVSSLHVILKKKNRNSKLVLQWHFLWWNVLQAIWDLIWHLKNQNKTLVYYKFYEAIHLWFLYFKSAHVLCPWRHLSWQVYFIRKEVKALMFPNVKLNLLQKSLHFWGETNHHISYPNLVSPPFQSSTVLLEDYLTFQRKEI